MFAWEKRLFCRLFLFARMYQSHSHGAEFHEVSHLEFFSSPCISETFTSADIWHTPSLSRNPNYNISEFSAVLTISGLSYSENCKKKCGVSPELPYPCYWQNILRPLKNVLCVEGMRALQDSPLTFSPLWAVLFSSKRSLLAVCSRELWRLAIHWTSIDCLISPYVLTKFSYVK